MRIRVVSILDLLSEPVDAFSDASAVFNLWPQLSENQWVFLERYCSNSVANGVWKRAERGVLIDCPGWVFNHFLVFATKDSMRRLFGEKVNNYVLLFRIYGGLASFWRGEPVHAGVDSRQIWKAILKPARKKFKKNSVGSRTYCFFVGKSPVRPSGGGGCFRQAPSYASGGAG